MMAKSIDDKSSDAYQRIAWETLEKSIDELINKVNVENIVNIVENLFKENIIRGRGLLCRSLLQAQAASLESTNVYAALIAVVNAKFPRIGELLVIRCLKQFTNSYRRSDKTLCLTDKTSCLATLTFIAHLLNQRVIHDEVALQILMFILGKPNDDSVELAIAFLKECGECLMEISPEGLNSVFGMLLKILGERIVSSRVQSMIEEVFQIRKDKFKDYPALIEELDLIEKDNQITHCIQLDDNFDEKGILNEFGSDPDYLENENKYKSLYKEILGDESEDDDIADEERFGDSDVKVSNDDVTNKR